MILVELIFFFFIVAWSDVPSAGEVFPEERVEMPLIPLVPSHPSGSSLRPEDKGKAPLEEGDKENGDEEEDEIPLQRKCRASDPPTLDVDPGLAPEDDMFLFPDLFNFGRSPSFVHF